MGLSRRPTRLATRLLNTIINGYSIWGQMLDTTVDPATEKSCGKAVETPGECFRENIGQSCLTAKTALSI